ncbi:mRNA binding protein puf3 [Coemansia interrupta]|uniref:Pumilio homology domain family member 3 n=1 Tax=Coemansia interrupta TaxID=1126814 RepID=A0A9W8HD30_9FUNG|nr:mRNA binding protein puf3 [Coemansia interrupta]
MSHLNEDSGSGAGSEDKPSTGNRQSRFQGHWDAAAATGVGQPSNPLHLHVSNSHPPANQNTGNSTLNVNSGGSQSYSWDFFLSGSKPTTPATSMGIQTFGDPADDDWSRLLDQTGSPASATTNRSSGYQGINLSRLGGLDASKSTFASIGSTAKIGLPVGGDSPVGVSSSRPRRQLVDIIQTDFPRTPSPAVAESSGLRPRASNTPLQRQGPSVDDTGAASALESHSLNASGALTGGQTEAVSPSAFSALSTSAPIRNQAFTSTSGLLADTSILGVPPRQPSAAPPSRSHSTVMLSSGNDASNVGFVLNSLLDQEDAPERRRSQVDIFGMSVGSPPGAAPAAPGQSLWAARHAARLDGLQRAASTPPRNAAAVAAAAVASTGTNAPGSAGPGMQTGAAAAANMWGGMDVGAGQQTPAALLRDNSLLSHGTSGPLTSGSLNIASSQLGVDDLNYGIRGLRIGEDNNRGLRSAELRVSHDAYGDIDGSASARLPGTFGGSNDHWDLSGQHGHPQPQHQQMQLQPQPHHLQAGHQHQRLYDSGFQLQSQMRLHGSQTAGAAAGPPPFVDNIVTDRNVLYGGSSINTAGIPLHSAGLGPGTAPHTFARTQSYNDPRFMRGTGPTSAYPLPQPIAQRPSLSGLSSAGVTGTFGSQGALAHNASVQAQQLSNHRIHSLPHTPHQQQQHPHQQQMAAMHMQQQQQQPQQQQHPRSAVGQLQFEQMPHSQQQQQQQQQQQIMMSRDGVVYGNPPPSLVSMQSSVGGTQMIYRGTPKSAATVDSPGAGSRSMVLEEFRNNKTRKYELKDICDHMVEFSCDQHGSRFIQQKLETASPEDKEIVFREVMPNSRHLMTDVFGNYVIQKFFEHGSQTQKHTLAKQMQGHILTLSLQMYGCRVVQKALEHVQPDQQASMVRELDGHVLQCVKDQNGNHVIQKAIERISVEHIRFIIDSFHGQIYSLATHPYGCRVIQRMFEHCDDTQTRPLLDELHRFTTNLVQDQYGNYVIQHVMERGKAIDRSLVCSRVRGHVLQLSKHKFASNVVEKCIAYGEPKDRKVLIDEITAVRRDGSSNLVYMMKDQYANYVVQKMLDVVDDQQREMIMSKIQAHMVALRKFTYGKHLISKVEKYLAMKENDGNSHAVSSSPTQPLAAPDTPSEQQSVQVAATGSAAATSKSSA